MKKLEAQVLQSALTEQQPTDLLTVRQAETLRSMQSLGLIRIQRDEQLKANLVIMEWRIGTAASARDAAGRETEDGEPTEVQYDQ